MAVILVVDDSMIIRKQLSVVLSKQGYEVHEAAGAEPALEILRGDAPVGLIISDVNMPGMNGLDMVAEIRTLEHRREIPIFMLTTESTEHLQKEGMEKGANAWIVKPFNEEQLLAGVAQVFACG